jgi:hypothetical protein
MTLQLLHSEFPYVWGKFDFLFYQCSFQRESKKKKNGEVLFTLKVMRSSRMVRASDCQ